jgi:hypothetical protein
MQTQAQMEEMAHATSKGFCCVENMRETEGAWSAGFCCFEHMVLYLDDGPTVKPVVRNESCYQRVLIDQARRQAQVPLDMLRAQREMDRDRNDLLLVSNRKNQRRKSRKPLNKLRRSVTELQKPGFQLTGTNLQETIKRHRNKMRHSIQTLPIHSTLV